MGREKAAEKLAEETVNSINSINSINGPASGKMNIIMQYIPLVVSLISLIVCYLLYKKIQSLNTQNDAVSKIETQIASFIKEQSEINTVNSKKFNTLVSQLNQLNYLIQNTNSRENNTFDTQMSPERTTTNTTTTTTTNNNLQQQQQQQLEKQREMIPTSVIQTSFPISPPVNQVNSIPLPTVTSNRIENEINENAFGTPGTSVNSVNSVIPNKRGRKPKEIKEKSVTSVPSVPSVTSVTSVPDKKVVNLQDNNDVIIEEVSSEEEN